MHSIITVPLLDQIPVFCFAVASLWEAAAHTLAHFIWLARILAAEGCSIFLCKKTCYGRGWSHRQHGVHSTNKWFQYKWDTKEQRGKHCCVKDAHLNKRLSYEAGNLFSKISAYRDMGSSNSILRVPHILSIGYPETHCALFHCFVLFLWFLKSFSLVNLAYKMHGVVFTK